MPGFLFYCRRIFGLRATSASKAGPATLGRPIVAQNQLNVCPYCIPFFGGSLKFLQLTKNPMPKETFAARTKKLHELKSKEKSSQFSSASFTGQFNFKDTAKHKDEFIESEMSRAKVATNAATSGSSTSIRPAIGSSSRDKIQSLLDSLYEIPEHLQAKSHSLEREGNPAVSVSMITEIQEVQLRPAKPKANVSSAGVERHQPYSLHTGKSADKKAYDNFKARMKRRK